jgi:hypothetical protein
MARLVVALVALAIMSAGSMYWASAQQTSDSSHAWDLSPLSASAIDAVTTDNNTTAACPAGHADCSKCEGCACDGSGSCPAQADDAKAAEAEKAKQEKKGCSGGCQH